MIDEPVVVRTLDVQTFVDVIQRLYAEQFTGRTIIDWAQGHPRVVEFPGAPTKIVLDSAVKLAQS